MIVLLVIQLLEPLQLVPFTIRVHFAEQLLELEFQLALAIPLPLQVFVRTLPACCLVVNLALFLQAPQLDLTLGFL